MSTPPLAPDTPARTDVGDAGSAPPLLLRAVVALAGCGSVAALLAWVSGFGPFHLWFLAVGIPAQLVMLGGYRWARRSENEWLTSAITAGVLGGIVGTIAYDLFRVPFVVAGLRVLAPIDSYGVLLLDASSSSPWTGLAGWTYHFLNGIGFGVAYAVVARGRHWGWGVAWAMVLESATVFSPFAGVYALHGKYGIIAIAYAAHVPFGLAIGHAARHADRVTAASRQQAARPLVAALGILAVGLVAWQRPVTGFETRPHADMTTRSFAPQWLRVPPGECPTVTNTGERPRLLETGQIVEPGQTVELCFADDGVHRVHVVEDDRKVAYSGGWVIVDPES